MITARKIASIFHYGLWLAAFVMVASCKPAPVNVGDGPYVRLESELGKLLQKSATVGTALGVVREGELVFAQGFGTARLGHNIPITPNSVFHWASVSKPVVAIAIMQLVERERLSLDDLLADCLPYFSMADPRFRQITVRQLLTHTSGMPDVEDYEWDKPQTDEGALKRWALAQNGKQLLFAPGSAREYSNLGFELLGLIVQETSGISFEEFIKQNIFAPLGMNNSSFIASEIDTALRVSGHVDETSRRIASDYPYNRRHAPSSTLNTSIVDMSRLVMALLNDGQLGTARILSPDSMKKMWATAWTSPDDPTRMAALGWNAGRNWGGVLAFNHAGHDDGFRSYLYIAPEQETAVFMVSNDDTVSTRDVVRLALRQVLPEFAPRSD